MIMILNAAILAIANPAATQAADPAHATHAAAPAGKTMPAHDAMTADGKMKPDADMMERCKKMHAAMTAKTGTAPAGK